MRLFKKFGQRMHPKPIKPSENGDLKCPRCQRLLAANFYEQYRAAPWATLHAERRCVCGYRVPL